MSPRRGHTRLQRPAVRETVAIARPSDGSRVLHGEYQADIKSYDDSCSDEESYEGSSSDSLARPALEPSPLEDFFVRQRVTTQSMDLPKRMGDEYFVAPVWVWVGYTKPPVIMDTHATRRVYRTRLPHASEYQLPKVQANCCNPHISRHISLFLSRASQQLARGPHAQSAAFDLHEG